ncbi:DUF5606 domain-containing protein [Lutimonas halocynthiae]|uniref:DUF5606 family protein n=1 Tax=Lutimonas halocynthiae TaxID=1446477 RepID=UPI0025B34F57|nr:DUF5606 domain-containing protein [Lutimonas halocynthiae]MDN3644441.1 DUF5606 domain-containing protein [Lutimonas halocynthiae]
MKLEKVIAIAGKPGLYEIISQSKSGVIVESLADKKRFPVNSLHNISTLNDIAIYTYEEEVPLKQVFLSIFEKQASEKSIDPKSSKNDLINYFGEVLPGFDEERVYPSNIKKILSWYNALVDAKFDFASIKQELEEENAEE